MAYVVGSVTAVMARRTLTAHPWTPWAWRAGELFTGAVGVSVLSELLKTPGPWPPALIATAIVAGRLFPLWGGETPGRGLFVAGGALSAITPLAIPLWAFLWALGFVASGYRTFGAVTGVVLLPVALGFITGWTFALMAVPVCVLILDRYRGGVGDLIDGQELKHHWRPGA